MENPIGDDDGKRICSGCSQVRVLDADGFCAECVLKIAALAPENRPGYLRRRLKGPTPEAPQTCEHCKWWMREPLANPKYADVKEHVCLRSRFTDFGAYGMDGKAIITHKTFGCNAWEIKP